ncbi:MAG TPA: hypothetical protein VMP68_02035 [Candidatus Eisenbacteria bacterium]|nr:hypothetical protein [Candidatus Eisenbacteria bacterium]
MASKDLMNRLSKRLEPIREEFELSLYRKSLELIEPQSIDDGSLFWRLPNRGLRNLHKFFLGDVDERLRFFIIAHACRNHRVATRLGQPVLEGEEILEVLRRCRNPTVSDVTERGFIPPSTPILPLNRRRLNTAIRTRLGTQFEEKVDVSEPNERSYESHSGPWQFAALIDTRGEHSQVQLEFEISMGMGDLTLSRQLSLHSLFGVCGTSWDLARPGEEGNVAELVGEYSFFMLDLLAPILRNLDPGILPEEVALAEKEWKEWLTEVRANRGDHPRQID